MWPLFPYIPCRKLPVELNFQLPPQTHSITVSRQPFRIIMSQYNPQIFAHPTQRRIRHLNPIIGQDFEDFLLIRISISVSMSRTRVIGRGAVVTFVGILSSTTYFLTRSRRVSSFADRNATRPPLKPQSSMRRRSVLLVILMPCSSPSVLHITGRATLSAYKARTWSLCASREMVGGIL